MKRTNTTKLLLKRLLSCIAMMTFSSFAITAPDKTDLQKIHQEIQNTQERISKNQQEENSLESSLQAAEVDLSHIERDKNTLNAAIEQQQQELVRLHLEEEKLLQEKSLQEKNIDAQINASYRMGHEKNVKVILNQQDTKELSRSLVYSDYITRARFESLQAFKQTLQQISDNKLAIENKTMELTASQQALAEKGAELQSSYSKRNESLKALQASIKNDENKISQLKNDQARLQELLEKIRTQQIAAAKAAEKARIAEIKREQARLAQIKAESNQQATITPKIKTETAAANLPAGSGSFAQAKGKLHWPAKGKLDNRYGKPRQPGDFRWDGVVFTAAMGSNVQSVYDGRVVFADWFRGKGLLLIIDHGNGYMSLYAHNQTLLKKAGDAVITGENIATLGNSGGLDSPQLYFEIRHQGAPIDPGFWLTNNG